MTEQALTLQQRRAALANQAKEIDRIASEAMTVFEQAGNFGQELQVAQAIVDMRLALTPEVMAPVMALMNTDLGFRTDRDPKISKEAVTPYSMEVVREVFIEAKLRGFHAVGNEFNIIASRFYGAQAGFKRKVKEKTAGTFEPSIDVPVIAPDGKSAKIRCRATWRVEGKGDVQSIGIKADDPCEFLVRVNAFMGADAINGKAERKLLKRVYERITGRSVPDADVEEGTINVTATVIPAANTPAPNFAAPPPDGARGEPATALSETHETKAAGAASDEKAEAELGLAPEGKPAAKEPDLKIVPPPPPGPAMGTVQGQLAAFLTDAGVTFEQFRKWADETDRLKDADSYGSWAELPADFCTELKANTKTLNKCIVRCQSY